MKRTLVTAAPVRLVEANAAADFTAQAIGLDGGMV
jgi:hypothetical protein